MAVGGLRPDGRTLAAGVDTLGLIRLWDTADGRVIRELRGHASGVMDLPSCRTAGRWRPRVGTGRSSSGTWQTGRELRTLRGHEGWVFGLAFAPDGQALATGGFSDGLRLWQAASLQDVATARVEEQAETDRRGAGASPPP